MKKKLIRTGNSAALVIEKSTMEAMGLDANSQVVVHFDGEKLTIQPAPAMRELISKLIEIEQANHKILKDMMDLLGKK
ncbi:MAG: hypothetical protein IPK68_13385 [Bdellovibrionales bacterium]|nr:hypothetical protein [Bdellovibrionales bacterium]